MSSYYVSTSDTDAKPAILQIHDIRNFVDTWCEDCNQMWGELQNSYGPEGDAAYALQYGQSDEAEPYCKAHILEHVASLLDQNQAVSDSTNTNTSRMQSAGWRNHIETPR